MFRETICLYGILSIAFKCVSLIYFRLPIRCTQYIRPKELKMDIFIITCNLKTGPDLDMRMVYYQSFSSQPVNVLQPHIYHVGSFISPNAVSSKTQAM